MSVESQTVADSNAEIFESARVASWYLDQGLDAAEHRLLCDWEADYRGRRALDLGVGTGRTTAMLWPCARDYLGVDLSEAMLERARTNFPGATLRRMDIRAVGDLPAASRDYVLAAYAVLDLFDHQQRSAVLAAIGRVLAPGGLLVFSFHNLLWREAGAPPRPHYSANPLRLARDFRQFLIGRSNYRARAYLERRGDEHAMLRDMAHQWRGVFHYITPQAQIAQLDALGFETTTMIGADGRDMRRDDPGLDDPMPYLRCRKR
jgi:SAM-dependent methyltransferase